MSDEPRRGFFAAGSRVELVATIIMALSAIFTAWAAFQSAKWSGEQATSFSMAGAARTESTRFDTLGAQQTAIDVNVYTSWLQAVVQDSKDGLVDLEAPSYEPTPGTLSGFLYERVRDEFKPAFDIWLDEFYADRETAPPSPFAMEEYVVENRVIAQEKLAEAEQHADDAGQANQNSDDYVLTAVAFALVLFFGGVSSKLENPRNGFLAIAVATVIFVGATIVLVSLPKILPF